MKRLRAWTAWLWRSFWYWRLGFESLVDDSEAGFRVRLRELEKRTDAWRPMPRG